MIDEILKVLPDEIKNQMSNLNAVTEIRLRCGYNCTFRSGIKEITTDHLVSKEEILSILRKVSDNSIYAVQKNINQGFLTVKGGHRIGIAGEVAMSAVNGSENVKIYEDKLDNIIREKNKINLIETLVKTKGIENLAINKTGEKIIAVVSGNNLTESQVALIKKIIQDELNVKTEDITITKE